MAYVSTWRLFQIFPGFVSVILKYSNWNAKFIDWYKNKKYIKKELLMKQNREFLSIEEGDVKKKVLTR